VDFIQANDQVYMFRGESLIPYFWDGTNAGFIPVPDPGSGDNIHYAVTALYHAGRMWVPNGDDIYSSNILNFNTYDDVHMAWSVNRLQLDAGVFLYPFHENGILAFKKTKIFIMVGVNTPLTGGTDYLSNHVFISAIDDVVGCVARNAIVTVGEDVWFLGYGGIYSINRNEQNKIDRNPVALSLPVNNIIQRINWSAVDVACAAIHDNYVLFAVPVDNSTTNNTVLVYDLLAGGGTGAWCGVWESGLLNPVKFFHYLASQTTEIRHSHNQSAIHF
jgi:hypothetical protein